MVESKRKAAQPLEEENDRTPKRRKLPVSTLCIAVICLQSLDCLRRKVALRNTCGPLELEPQPPSFLRDRKAWGAPFKNSVIAVNTPASSQLRHKSSFGRKRWRIAR